MLKSIHSCFPSLSLIVAFSNSNFLSSFPLVPYRLFYNSPSMFLFNLPIPSFPILSSNIRLSLLVVPFPLQRLSLLVFSAISRLPPLVLSPPLLHLSLPVHSPPRPFSPQRVWKRKCTDTNSSTEKPLSRVHIIWTDLFALQSISKMQSQSWK